MKIPFKLKNIVALILCAVLLTCSDDNEEEQLTEYPVSYAQFTIDGPITVGTYEYRDANASDEFEARGRLYTTEEEPDFAEDQIQLYVGKSLALSNFLVVAPNETGTNTILYQGGPNDFDVNIHLASPEENYYAKEVSIIITELELNGNTVTYCKGTFYGDFYRDNLVESQVHYIDGEFEINR